MNKKKIVSHRISRFIAEHNPLYGIIRPVIKLAMGIEFYRKKYNLKNEENEVRSVLSGKVVLHGPFAGLKYPDFESFGSMVFPKLLGSYECELEYVWQRIVAQQYDCILDIGCAEGYYSVGMAMKMNAAVIAVDINRDAINLMLRIAELNGVRDRIIVPESKTTEDVIAEFDGIRGFILCDAEGYEGDIFNQSTISYLRNCDILIEVHEAMRPGISKYLSDLFQQTHSLEIISSIDDIKKAQILELPEMSNLSIKAKRLAVSELRSNIQDWFYFTSKHSA